MTESDRQRSFAVDIQGLLVALTEQFPDPLLCVRELVQNAADAGAARIEVEVAFDPGRQLFRLAVRDDGRGMGEGDVQGYLTIGFSEKRADRDRGRFGIGKLSPYALGITRMVVETSDGRIGHRITFRGDGSGELSQVQPVPARGTLVRVYKACEREEAERLADRTRELVEEQCGTIGIPLYVNGAKVNREMGLATPYAHRFASATGQGTLGITAEPVRLLMGGGIVLEKDAEIFGPEISYLLDSSKLSPTLSRNSVRRDATFDALIRAARAELPAFTAVVAREFRVRVDRFLSRGEPVERMLDQNDRAALEWLRQQLLRPDDDPPDESVLSAPVLETVDGGLVAASELFEVLRREGRVPTSRVPRTREEVGAYVDRGVPVLLLYRDLEDFFERRGISAVEIDDEDAGSEVLEHRWSAGEAALARRLVSTRPRRVRFGVLASTAAGLTLAVAIGAGLGWLADGSGVEPPLVTGPLESIELPPPSATHASVSPVVPRPSHPGVVALATVLAVVSAAIGLALVILALDRRRPGTRVVGAGAAPLTVGEASGRRFDVLRRAVFHPIDFFVARGWSIRAAGDRGVGPLALRGYRELLPEPPIRSGVRLDLDRIAIGFVDLVSSVGEPHDGRILVRRGDRVLLNRNHPTVRDLIRVASVEPKRARVLLEILLATDGELAKGTDPRQVEWDLLGRGEHGLRSRS